MKLARRYYILALLIVVVDQAVKVLVKLTMQPGEELHVLGNFFKIHFIENAGAAFGLTLTSLLGTVTQLSETTGKLILTLFSLVLVGFIGYFLYTLRRATTALPWLMALVLGGAVGNIIDRVFYGVWFASINNYQGGLLHGRVVDMFYFDIWQGILPNWLPLWGGEFYAFWPIFNIADSAISVGIVAILLFQRRLFSTKPASVASAPPTTASPLDAPAV